jgi:hypothetical protein
MSSVLFAQDPHRKNSFGIYQAVTDYNVELLNNKPFAFDSSLSFTTRVAYQRLLSKSWVLNTGLSQGFINNQTLNSDFNQKAFHIGADVNLMFKLNNGRLIREEALFGPYAVFGIRGDYIPVLNKNGFNPWLVHNQYGLGTSVRLGSRTHLQVQAVIDQKIMDDINTHIQYRAGITQSIGAYKEDRPAPAEKKAIDSDGDGVTNALDNCPDVFGVVSNNGCPDTVAVATTNEKDSLYATLSERDARIDKLQERIDSLNRELLIADEEDARKKRLEEKRKEEEKIKLEKKDEEAVKKEEEEIELEEKDEEVDKKEEEEIKSDLPADKNYYVITWSSNNYASSVSWLNDLKKKFPKAVILPQPNGYYRVGVYGGKNKAKALELLSQIKESGYTQLWLSAE